MYPFLSCRVTLWSRLQDLVCNLIISAGVAIHTVVYPLLAGSFLYTADGHTLCHETSGRHRLPYPNLKPIM